MYDHRCAAVSTGITSETSAERLKILQQKAAKTTHEEQTAAALPLNLDGVSRRI